MHAISTQLLLLCLFLCGGIVILPLPVSHFHDPRKCVVSTDRHLWFVALFVSHFLISTDYFNYFLKLEHITELTTSVNSHTSEKISWQGDSTIRDIGPWRLTTGAPGSTGPRTRASYCFAASTSFGCSRLRKAAVMVNADGSHVGKSVTLTLQKLTIGLKLFALIETSISNTQRHDTFKINVYNESFTLIKLCTSRYHVNNVMSSLCKCIFL